MDDRSRRTASGAAWALALSMLVRAHPARAGAFDVLGAGPVGVAEAGARVARADDGTAAFFNPAGLAMGRGVGIMIAPQGTLSSLTIQGQTEPLLDPIGFVVSADATVPFRGPLSDRIRVGAALYLPPDNAIRLVIAKPEEPQLPYFANRTQRLVVVPALAVRITDAISIGAGLNVLGGVQGPADVRAGASGAPEPRISVDATTQVGVHVGVRADLAEHVHLGAAYRQEFSVPIFITTKADIGGIALTADANIRHALFDPHTFVLGAAFDIGRLQLEIDVSYSAWSAYDGPVLGVRAELPGALLTSEARREWFRDVVSARGATSYGIDVGRSSEVLLHAGLGFEPTILTTVPQGVTSFADGPKVLGGVGASLALRDVLPRTVRIAAGLGVTGMLDQTIEKRACQAAPCPPGTVSGPDPEEPSQGITNPGFPRLSSGGALWTGSIGVGVDL